MGNNLSGQTILVMRALWEQRPLIETAVESGAEVVAIDKKDKADGFRHADHPEVVPSLRDVDECLSIAREYDIDAILTDECDYSLLTAAYIGEHLSLPAVSLSTGLVTTNKKRVRQTLDGVVKQPEYDSCITFSDVKRAASRIGYSLIIKPVDNRGAFGVTHVTEYDQLRDGYLTALANSHAREVLVERFVEGTPITVEGYYIGGDHKTLTVGSKNTEYGNLDPKRELVYPAQLPEQTLRSIREVNDSVAASLNSSFGATHGEYIVTDDDDCYLLEFHNRGGGIHISAKVVPAITGFSVSEHLLADTTGLSATLQRTGESPECSVVLHPLELPSGEIQELRGRSKVEANPDVLTFQEYFEPGDELTALSSPITAHGLIIARGPTPTKARETIFEVYECLDPVYAEKQTEG